MARRLKSRSEHISYPRSDDLPKLLQHVSSITSRIRLVGLAAFGLTIFSYCILLMVLGGRIFHFVSLRVVVATSCMVDGVALLAVVAYESLRRKGDVLFEEVSDELQWHTRGEVDSSEKSDDRPDIQARVVLRDFARKTDLPLAPGKFGPAIYVSANIISLLIQLYFLGPFRHKKLSRNELRTVDQRVGE